MLHIEQYDIQYLVRENGYCPFSEWLDTLDNQVQTRILAGIDKLALGNFSNCKPVGNGIHEYRYHFGPGYRMYFTIKDNMIIIIICAGDKSKQKNDIQVAKKFAEEYDEPPDP